VHFFSRKCHLAYLQIAIVNQNRLSHVHLPAHPTRTSSQNALRPWSAPRVHWRRSETVSILIHLRIAVNAHALLESAAESALAHRGPAFHQLQPFPPRGATLYTLPASPASKKTLCRSYRALIRVALVRAPHPRRVRHYRLSFCHFPVPDRHWWFAVALCIFAIGGVPGSLGEGVSSTFGRAKLLLFQACQPPMVCRSLLNRAHLARISTCLLILAQGTNPADRAKCPRPSAPIAEEPKHGQVLVASSPDLFVARHALSHRAA